jgi:hypothetical protein
VADHALLVGVRDRAAFECGHVGEGLLHLWRHLDQELVREWHPRDIKGEAELGVVVKVGLKA